MAFASIPLRPHNHTWFIAWFGVGIVLVVGSCILIDQYFHEWRVQQAFRLCNPTAEELARRRCIELIQMLPVFLIVYALVGLWFFRRRGCVAVIIAVIFVCSPCLFQAATGLGGL